jgi:hypothetical protein
MWQAGAGTGVGVLYYRRLSVAGWFLCVAFSSLTISLLLTRTCLRQASGASAAPRSGFPLVPVVWQARSPLRFLQGLMDISVTGPSDGFVPHCSLRLTKLHIKLYADTVLPRVLGFF